MRPRRSPPSAGSPVGGAGGKLRLANGDVVDSLRPYLRSQQMTWQLSLFEEQVDLTAFCHAPRRYLEQIGNSDKVLTLIRGGRRFVTILPAGKASLG